MTKDTTFKIHFILGIGRSGTSLLSSLLDTHPNLKCTPEAVFLVFFLHKYKNQNITLEQFKLMLEHINIYGISHPWVGWKFDEHAAISEFNNLRKERAFLDYASTCEILYRNFKNLLSHYKSVPKVVDKNPSYSLYANHLEKTFSNAHFILLFRDYRANILSRKQSVYLKSSNVAFNAFRWRLFNKKLLRFAKLNPSKCFKLNYENLVQNKEMYLEQLILFLNEEPADIKENHDLETLMIKDEFEIPDAFKDRYNKKYGDLNKEVNSKRISSWENELTALEIKIGDVFCGKVGKEAGYTPRHSFNIFEKIYYYCRYIIPVLKAIWDIKKDAILFYFPPTIKLIRLKKSYKKLGLINNNSLIK
jgi:hypothetical protein